MTDIIHVTIRMGRKLLSYMIISSQLTKPSVYMYQNNCQLQQIQIRRTLD